MAKIEKPKFETQEYTLKSELLIPESEQTKWKIRGLTVEYKAQIGDVALDKKNVSCLLLAFKYGCVGWSNLFVDSEPLQFEGLKYNDGIFRVHPKFLNESGDSPVIPLEWQIEIGWAIIELSGLSNAEKN